MSPFGVRVWCGTLGSESRVKWVGSGAGETVVLVYPLACCYCYCWLHLHRRNGGDDDSWRAFVVAAAKV